MKHIVVCSALLILTALLMAACVPAAGQSTQGPTTWIDDPLDGSSLPLGPMEITAHASDSDGVASFDFHVDSALLAHAPAVASAPVQVYSTGYSGAPGTAGYLASATVGWNPTTPGVYTIRAVATDTKGNVGSEAKAVVTVGEVEGSPTPSPAVPPTEEIVTGETPSPGPPTVTPIVPTWTPPPPGVTPLVPTWTPKPPTVTPPPPATRAEIAYFQANPSTINKGECSTLSWDVHYAAAVYLDGQGVTAPNTQQVCPPTSTTYTLFATSAGGDDQETAIVTVIEAPTPTPIVSIITPEPIDTTPPTIYPVEMSDYGISTDNYCSSCECTTIAKALVSDNTGVSTVFASLAGISVDNVPMYAVGGGWYQAELGPFANWGALLVTVVAQDYNGNPASAPPMTVNVINGCID